MHIELVESLRCPFPHEETWLVASVMRFDGRDIVEGSLGCPVCRRQFAVVAGEVDFTATRDERPSDANTAAPAALAALSTDAPPDDSTRLRARALLSLDSPGGIVLVGGAHAAAAEWLSDAAQVTTIVLNAHPAARHHARHPSAIRAGDGVVPLAPGALRGAWLDAASATPETIAGVTRALRRGGRLVAPADAPVPPGVRELARDATEWVGEAEGAPAGSASAPVPLRRR